MYEHSIQIIDIGHLNMIHTVKYFGICFQVVMMYEKEK